MGFNEHAQYRLFYAVIRPQQNIIVGPVTWQNNLWLVGRKNFFLTMFKEIQE